MSIADSTPTTFLDSRDSGPNLRLKIREVLPLSVHFHLEEINRLEPSFQGTKRQREFSAGRVCANVALDQVGSQGPVGQAKDRSPIWPDNVNGSITHNDRYACAAVTNDQRIRSLGIDIESVVTPKTLQLLRQEIVTDQEWELAQTLDHAPEIAFTIIFSAKESFYKCWYPVTHEYFGFKQAVVQSIDAHEVVLGMNHGNPNYLRSPHQLHVRYQVASDLVVTATTMQLATQEAE